VDADFRTDETAKSIAYSKVFFGGRLQHCGATLAPSLGGSSMKVVVKLFACVVFAAGAAVLGLAV
jgi:hypothetical protein